MLYNSYVFKLDLVSFSAKTENFIFVITVLENQTHNKFIKKII